MIPVSQVIPVIPASQVIPVIPVSQVIPVIPESQVIPVIPVSQVIPVSPVSQVRLAHLWVNFRVFFLCCKIKSKYPDDYAWLWKKTFPHDPGHGEPGAEDVGDRVHREEDANPTNLRIIHKNADKDKKHTKSLQNITQINITGVTWMSYSFQFMSK